MQLSTFRAHACAAMRALVDVPYLALQTLPHRRANTDETHACAAAGWLIRAQRVSGSGGFSHSYHLLRGWLPPYPETTGYIVPTLHRLYQRNNDPALRASIVDAVAWLKSVQQWDGSFTDLQGNPQVFDTGQILIGLNYLAEQASDLSDEEVLARAARWLASVQDADGSFITHAYNKIAHSYYARVGAAMAAVGRLLNDAKLFRGGVANLNWVLAQQESNGFFRNLSFDQLPPFLHTMVYVIEGLLDGHAETGTASLLAAVIRFAERLLEISQKRDHILRSQYNSDFTVANPEKCMTGLAQWAAVCFRIARITKDDSYRAEGLKTVEFLKLHQIQCHDGNLQGGLWGSDPPWGRYMRLSIPNWGVKFFIDALLEKMAASPVAPSAK